MKKWKYALAALCMAAACSGGITASAAATQNYLGDVTLDDEVDVRDIIQMQKYLLGLVSLDEQAMWLGDVCTDNVIDVFDLALLKRGISTGDWSFYNFEPETTEPETTEPEPTEPETTEPLEESDEFIQSPIAAQDLSHNLPSQGVGNLVAFYISFPDASYDYLPDEAYLNEICFGAEDTSNSNYPHESMSAFYARSSKGTMQLQGQAFIYTAKENMSAYSNDKNKLVKECYEAFKDSVDFSQFDGDGDGDIDATLLTVPSVGDDANSWGGDWWPCAGPSSIYNYTVDGMSIGHLITGNAQIVSAENYKNFTSSYLHEMGHCMGLPDYYLYSSDDGEGFHGDQDAAGLELMDIDASSDFCCFSKLMLGWYRRSQVQVFDTAKGGTQTFTLSNAQTNDGNCLILPYGNLDSNYLSEYMIVEYITSENNNSNNVYNWLSSGNGIRVYHVKADMADNGWWKFFKYENGSEYTNNDDAGIRLIRLANDAEGGAVFQTGAVIDGNLSGFHWYDANENESVDTGYSITVGDLQDGQYTVTVTAK